MQAIRIWAVAVCAAAIAASVAQLAAPEGKVQKALRCVIGLFLFAVLWLPLQKGYRFPLGIMQSERILQNRQQRTFHRKFSTKQPMALVEMWSRL